MGAEAFAVTAAPALAVGGLSAAGARSRNAAITNTQARTTQSFQVAAGQTETRRNRETEEARRAAARVEGRLRTISAFTGTAGSGSDERLEAVNRFESGRNIGFLTADAADRIQSLRITRDNQLASLESRRQSEFLAGLGGIVRGAQAGLSLFSATGGGG